MSVPSARMIVARQKKRKENVGAWSSISIGVKWAKSLAAGFIIFFYFPFYFIL
jgi:hypothetical protein